VRTTLPFFRWLTAQPEFHNADFHTAWLDGVLTARKGEPFASASDADVRDAVIAAAAHAFRTASSAAASPAAGDRRASKSSPESGWRQAARLESLR
jgi:hypothetical protein